MGDMLPVVLFTERSCAGLFSCYLGSQITQAMSLGSTKGRFAQVQVIMNIKMCFSVMFGAYK